MQQTKRKGRPDPRDPKLYSETDAELLKIPRDEVTKPLTTKQRIFCEEYVRNYNVTLAAKNAGYSKKAAHVLGWKLRQDPKVNKYIGWLKAHVGYNVGVDSVRIVDQYIKIAFADINDFVAVSNGKVRVKDTTDIDGQIVTEIKQGRDGITVKLADKMRALEKLEHYFNVMPADWKEKLERRKLKLMQEKLELEKLKAGQLDNEEEDDGFIQALTSTAEEVWSE